MIVLDDRARMESLAALQAGAGAVPRRHDDVLLGRAVAGTEIAVAATLLR